MLAPFMILVMTPGSVPHLPIFVIILLAQRRAGVEVLVSVLVEVMGPKEDTP